MTGVRPREVYRTVCGSMVWGDSQEWLPTLVDSSVSLVLTSPPFALTRKKEYGNHAEDKYVEWFDTYAEQFRRILRDDGSLVIDLGGAWLPGGPTKSLYQYKLLISLVEKHGFHLAEDFYWFNRAKLPGPREWVTKDRVRVKDAVNTIWWLSKTLHPKADNRRVLRPYSKSMLRLLRRGTYNSGMRPSEHLIGENWAKDQGGAIPPNVIEVDQSIDLDTEDVLLGGDPDNMLDFGNTSSSDSYHVFCRANELRQHPARFPRAVPEFFIKFLTDETDLVVDPFAGSNVTGEVAESLGRRWAGCELDLAYIPGSLGRFDRSQVTLTSAGTAAGLSLETGASGTSGA